MLGLSQHAPRRAQKDYVGRAAGAVGGAIEGLVLDANGQAAEDNRCAIEAVVAPNQANVVLVQSQVVLPPQHQRGCRSGRAGAHAGLEEHAGDRAGLFAELSRLAAAASAVKSLAANVIVPSAAGIDVVQDLFAHRYLAAPAAEHGSAPAGRFLAGCLAHGDLELVGVVDVFTVRCSVLSLGDFVAAERFFGETRETHGGCWLFLVVVDGWMDGYDAMRCYYIIMMAVDVVAIDIDIVDDVVVFVVVYVFVFGDRLLF